MAEAPMSTEAEFSSFSFTPILAFVVVGGVIVGTAPGRTL